MHRALPSAATIPCTTDVSCVRSCLVFLEWLNVLSVSLVYQLLKKSDDLEPYRLRSKLCSRYILVAASGWSPRIKNAFKRLKRAPAGNEVKRLKNIHASANLALLHSDNSDWLTHQESTTKKETFEGQKRASIHVWTTVMAFCKLDQERDFRGADSISAERC